MKKLQAFFFLALTFLPTLLNAGPPDLRKTQITNRVGFADIILILLCMVIGLLAFSLFCSVMKPKQVKAGGERLSKGLMKPFFAGLLLFVFYAMLYKLCDNIPYAYRYYARPGIFTLAFIHFAFGFVLVANFIGERILANVGSAQTGSTFLTVLFGGLVLLSMNLLFGIGNLAFLFCVMLSLGIIPIAALRK